MASLKEPVADVPSFFKLLGNEFQSLVADTPKVLPRLKRGQTSFKAL